MCCFSKDPSFAKPSPGIFKLGTPNARPNIFSDMDAAELKMYLGKKGRQHWPGKGAPGDLKRGRSMPTLAYG